MNQRDSSIARWVSLALAVAGLSTGGCGGGTQPAGGGTGGTAVATGTGGGTSTGGVVGAGSSGGTFGSSGGASSAGGAGPNLGTGGFVAPSTGGTVGTISTGGSASTGGVSGTGGSGGAPSASGGAGGRGAGTGGGRAGTGGATGSGGAGNCSLPATVSYQKDVQGFLIKSCGGGNGCHVIDAVSTMASGGFNHGYDWITAGAHASSCPTMPKRFEIVLDVINQANPATCSKSRKMPPPDATGAGLRAPLTVCEIAALQAWLNEPMVTQMHRLDDSSPTTPYPMPPFN